MPAADVREQVARSLWIGEQETDETRDAAARYWDDADLADSVIPRPYYRTQADRLANAGLLATAGHKCEQVTAADNVIRAMLDALGVGYDRDPVIAAREAVQHREWFGTWLDRHDAQVAGRALRNAADDPEIRDGNRAWVEWFLLDRAGRVEAGEVS